MKRIVVCFQFVFLFFAGFSQADVVGKITDDKDFPLEFVSVQMGVGEAVRGLITDDSGVFTFPKSWDKNAVLIFSGLGFERLVVSLSHYTEGQEIHIILTRKDYTLRCVDLLIRLPDNIPVARTDISKTDLEKQNSGVDLPVMLELQPSTVSTSDAGTGIGYTAMRIRGSDASRINLTVNGVPINDPESQQVFWVNMPDLASGADGLQVQRGVGSSVNGAGAFGASIHIKTTDVPTKPFLRLLNTVGSFKTLRNTFQAGTGFQAVGNWKWYAEGRASSIRSNGYIDRSAANLKGYYLEAGVFDSNNSLKILTFGGKEITHQAWYGVPKARLENDSLGMAEYAANTGLSPVQTENLFNSDRRYNHYLYNNQIDDYAQTNYQLHYQHFFKNNLKLQTALHYTKGKGFFEEFQDVNAYSDNTALSDYGLPNLVVGGDTLTHSNLVRKRWLDNDFYGIVASVEKRIKSFNWKAGAAINTYKGLHFGEVVWANYFAKPLPGQRYYEDAATKTDFNAYTQLNYKMAPQLELWLDLQYRAVWYAYQDLAGIKQDTALHFFNPKIGINSNLWGGFSVFGCVGIANREPNRNDYVESVVGKRPKSERLYDAEFTVRYKQNRISAEATAYGMFYTNELVLTGQLNDVGAYTRTNVPNSRRLGVELASTYHPCDYFTFRANATFSKNKINSYTAFYDNWDEGTQTAVTYTDAPLAFSPGIIFGSEATVHCLGASSSKSLDMALSGKYVGKQYLDNTGNAAYQINPYFVSDFRLGFALKKKGIFESVGFNFWVRNLFDTQYESNGWVYRFISGGAEKNLNGYFPQAGRSFMLGVDLGF